jgi:transcriptional regulator with XRE-family HTH domain
MDVGKIIRAARMRARISQTELARRIGVTRSAVSQWEKKGGTTPELDNMKKLSEILNLDGPALLGLSPSNDRSATTPSAEMPALSLDRTISLNQRVNLPLSLPIRGTLSTGPGGIFFMRADHAVSYVRRPPRLEERDDVYGVYVEDTTMEPAFRHGSLVLLEESPPPRKGDDVVMELEVAVGATPRPVLRHLADLDAESYTLQQYSPPETITIQRAQVRSMHRVLTMLDLFGK